MSLTLSQVSTLDGFTIAWANAGSNLKEITLVYYKNAAGSPIQSMSIDPSLTDINLPNLDAYTSYSLQLQTFDGTNTVYSNILSVITPAILTTPSIGSIAGKDNALLVALQADLNTLTSADSVEFVLKRSDGVLFWIVKPFSSSLSYTLSQTDNANLVNNYSYDVACMYQPAVSNTKYSAPSAISATVNATPSNTPNIPTNLILQSNYIASNYRIPRLQFSWVQPSDYLEWNTTNFSIALTLIRVDNNTQKVYTLPNFAGTNYAIDNDSFIDVSGSYSFSLVYSNINGLGVSASLTTSPVVPLEAPIAPVLTSVIEGNGQNTLNWTLPIGAINCGNQALQQVSIYRNGVLISGLTPSGVPTGITPDVNNSYIPLSFVDTGLANGTNYSYQLTCTNSQGASVMSNTLSGNPYGNIVINSVSASGNIVSANVSPNGRPITEMMVVALSANPQASDNVYQLINVSNTSVSGSYNLSASFAFTVAKYMVVIDNAFSHDVNSTNIA